MAFDALSLSVLCKEFVELLVDSKITKIYQPERDEILLFLHGKTPQKLIISANATVNRIHLTDKTVENPESPPTFCMLLRKHISNAQITNIVQMPYERVLDFFLFKKDDLGYDKNLHLIFELTGKTSNIFLCDQDYTVIDSIKHLPRDLSTKRIIVNGGKYQFFPAQQKIFPCDSDRLAHLLNTSTLPYHTLLKENMLGVSNATVNEMLFGLDCDNHNSATTALVLQRIQKYICNLKNKKPNVVFFNGSLKDVCPFDYASVKGEKLFFETLNQAHDNYYYFLDSGQRFNSKAKSISTIVKNAISRTEKKLAIQRQSVLDASNNLENKVFGDLILSNLHNIKSCDSVLKAVNYYDENCPVVEIQLETGKSPQQNAQLYYKKYQKQKSTIIHNQKLIEENQKVLDYLLTVLQSLKFCTLQSDLAEITAELTDAGIIKPPKKQNTGKNSKKQEKQLTSAPLHYSICGFNVLVGKNNVQNDTLTFKTAKPNDIWLHTQSVHSSHVVVESQGKTVPDEVILTASQICAYFSQARQGTKIAVDYTQKSNVKKPKGKFQLGFVTYTNYSTVIVDPSEHRQLLKEI